MRSYFGDTTLAWMICFPLFKTDSHIGGLPLATPRVPS